MRQAYIHTCSHVKRSHYPRRRGVFFAVPERQEMQPLNASVAAISCGISDGAPVLDLDYAEDSQAMTDANFVLTGTGGIVEIQATAEGAPFDDESFAQMLSLARAGPVSALRWCSGSRRRYRGAPRACPVRTPR